jgi:hypothetical protein
MADSEEIAAELANKARNIAWLEWLEQNGPPEAVDFKEEFKQILEKYK